jgi:hypothetical protein
MSTKKWEPTDLREFFEKLQGLEMIVIGGQAINLWAIRYGKDDPFWAKHLPYTSEDLDFLGGPTEALACKNSFNSWARINDGSDPSPNAGVIFVPWKGVVFRIDILTSVHGVSTTDVEQNALKYEGQGVLNGINLKVLHPVHCIESKAANLAHLPQASRQDEKHLRISMLVMQQFLQEPQHSARSVFNLCERIYAIARCRTGRDVFLKTGIKIEEAIPIDYLNRQAGFELFLEKRLPQLDGELQKKRATWDFRAPSI